MKEIKLTQGKVALVDDCDYDVLRQYNWYAARYRKAFYAERTVPKPGGGQKTERMHRVVLARKLGRDIKPGLMPDTKMVTVLITNDITYKRPLAVRTCATAASIVPTHLASMLA